MKNKLIMKVLVNLITTCRMLFSFFLLFLIPKIDQYIFLTIIIILFLTDSLDGILARKFQVQTLYGSTMDTIADKTLSIILLLPLLKKLNVILLILLGELGIAIINIWGRIQHKTTKSSIGGKIKMWILSITILLGYFFYFGLINYQIVEIAIYITVGFQCYVLFDYICYLKKQTSIKAEKHVLNHKKDLLYVLFDTKYYLENSETKN